MSLNVQIVCPYCKRQIAASLAAVGQRIPCPHCRNEVQLNPAALLAPAGAAGRAGGTSGTHSPPGLASPGVTPDAPRHSAPPGTATTIVLPQAPPGVRLPIPPQAPPGAPPPAVPTRALTPQVVSPPPAPPGAAPGPPSAGAAPPVTQSRTAQFLPAKAQASAIVASADGKLPTLQLADAPDAKAPAKTESAPTPLWLALLAVVGSMAISLLLLTNDFEGTASSQKSKVQARTDLAAFYGNNVTPLAPFQVHLREAQLAHSRGDYAAERDRYRRVLRLLRAERRSKYDFLTGTPSGDAELARLLSILLSTD